MTRKITLFVTAFLLLTVGGVVFLRARADAPTAPNAAQTQNPTPSDAPLSLNTPNTGSYTEYNVDTVTNVSGRKVLFFHAPWCSQCRSIEAGIKEQGVPAGLTIIKVDYDSNQTLRQKYGVTLQTTFVEIGDGGEFISKYVAYDEPTFDAVKRNYL